MSDNRPLIDEPREEVRVGTEEEMRAYFHQKESTASRLKVLALGLVGLALVLVIALMTSCSSSASSNDQNTNSGPEPSTTSQSTDDNEATANPETDANDSDQAVTPESNGEDSATTEGSTVSMALTNTEGSGFFWSYVPDNENILEEVSSSIDGDVTTYVFNAINPGTVTLNFDLTERGHSEESMSHVSYTFNVSEDLLISSDSFSGPDDAQPMIVAAEAML